MTSTERFKIVMDILNENDLCNNTRNHTFFEKLSDDDLTDENKVNVIIEAIKDYENKLNNKYPEYIMQKLRQCRELDQYDTSKDKEINTLTPSEVFKEVLSWEGLIGYDYTIKSYIWDIFKIRIE